MSTRTTELGRFSSFATVGGLGFLVDAAVLSFLVHAWGWPHYSARSISFATAVTVTWYCNRRWVFAATRDRKQEYKKYVGVQVVGAVINLGTYALAVALFPSLAQLPVIPLAAGAGVALLFNYSGASRWVFAAARPDGRQSND